MPLPYTGNGAVGFGERAKSEQKQGTQSAGEAAMQQAVRVLSYGADFNAGLVEGFFVDGLWGDATFIWGAIRGTVSGIGFLGAYIRLLLRHPLGEY